MLSCVPQGHELWQVILDNKPFLWPAYLLSSNYGAQRAFLFPLPIVLCLKRWTGSRYILFLLDWQGLSDHSMNWSWKGPARPALGFPHSLWAVGGLSCVWVPTQHSECVGWSEGEEGSPADTDCPQKPVGKVGVSKATSASPLGGALNHLLNWNDLFSVDKNQEFGLVCWNKESRFAPVPVQNMLASMLVCLGRWGRAGRSGLREAAAPSGLPECWSHLYAPRPMLDPKALWCWLSPSSASCSCGVKAYRLFGVTHNLMFVLWGQS